MSEALLTLSSAAAAAVAAGPAPPTVQHQQPTQQQSQMYANTPGVPSAFAVTPSSSTHYQAQPQVTVAPTAASYAPAPSATANHWQQQLVDGHQHAALGVVLLETPKHAARRVSVSSHSSSSTEVMMSATAAAPATHATAALYHPHPMMYAEDAQARAAKKARTVSPLPADNTAAVATSMVVGRAVSPNTQLQNAPSDDYNCVSCICPICNRQIKGLGDHKVDWSQPVQGRQRAKTITSIKKHVKDFHEQEPIWNVIVNSLDIGTAATPSSSSAMAWKYHPDNTKQQQQSRVVTAHAFVTQALKKAALDQIPNTQEQLRSFRWTEKMLDQRVGIAKGFIQFGGQEYLRNKECQDENGVKVNPKSLRNLAYILLQSMYDKLLQAWNRNQAAIEHAMGVAPLGLLRNRFQLLFASPDKWQDSWYMDPSKYGLHHHHHAGIHSHNSR